MLNYGDAWDILAEKFDSDPPYFAGEESEAINQMIEFVAREIWECRKDLAIQALEELGVEEK